MKYNELNIKSNKHRNRVGRGISAGQGKTAGRGTKGQNSRSGSTSRVGFEGGQNPLSQRFPKLRGFKSHRKVVEVVQTGQLDVLPGTIIDSNVLAKALLVSSEFALIKLVKNGTIDRKLSVNLQFASSGAVTEIQKKGGKYTKTEQLKRPKTSTSKSKNSKSN